MKLSNKRVLKADKGYYERGLETVSHIFFVQIINGAIAGVRMFDRKMTLINDSCFALNNFNNAITNAEYSWMSKKVNNLNL